MNSCTNDDRIYKETLSTYRGNEPTIHWVNIPKDQGLRLIKSVEIYIKKATKEGLTPSRLKKWYSLLNELKSIFSKYN